MEGDKTNMRCQAEMEVQEGNIYDEWWVCAPVLYPRGLGRLPLVRGPFFMTSRTCVFAGACCEAGGAKEIQGF
jgi:hypothetical protein